MKPSVHVSRHARKLPEGVSPNFHGKIAKIKIFNDSDVLDHEEGAQGNLKYEIEHGTLLDKPLTKTEQAELLKFITDMTFTDDEDFAIKNALNLRYEEALKKKDPEPYEATYNDNEPFQNAVMEAVDLKVYRKLDELRKSKLTGFGTPTGKQSYLNQS